MANNNFMLPSHKSSHIAGLVGGVLVVAALISSIGISVSQSPSSAGIANASNVKYVHFQYAADFSDDRTLVGASHNIFVGKVIKQIGSQESNIGPESQFEVEIIENVKGDLKGVVTVNQFGGYKEGVLYAAENEKDFGSDSYILQPGATYLFATRYSEKENWHTLNPHSSAKKLLSSDKDSSLEQLQAMTGKDNRVAELKSAYPKERLLAEDEANGNARNSYRGKMDMHEDASTIDESETSEEDPSQAENR